ncbi:glycosyltransferase family 2 protein [Butyricimonas faecihominis]|jgi:N-acetyllactosaminide beta-1,6-N-acetylglucosaminyl-transferase|uniref:glycosyltransferase family 2 protein n=1 Tax=Butyricimonas faecihominis TaxID=1472416 RepID=UPI0032BF9118
MSKVSIIIPVYNAEKTLCRCLDSLVAQTYEDIEIILVNDGSVDSSRNICETYKDKFSQISLINQKNAGPATARNVGIDCASGKYISFVDADDYVECNMIEEMVRAAETSHAEMVICGYNQEHSGIIVKHEYKYDSGLYVGEEAKKIAIDLISDVSAKRIPPYSWVRMILKDSLENPKIRYTEGMIRSEDYYLFVQLHFRVKRLYLLADKPLYHYMEIDNSVTHRYVPNYWTSVKEIYCGLLEKLPEDEEIKKRLGVMLMQRSLVALNNVSKKKSKDMLRKELYEIVLDEDLNFVISKMNDTSYLKSYVWLMSNHAYLIIYWRYLLKFYRNKIFS